MSLKSKVYHSQPSDSLQACKQDFLLELKITSTGFPLMKPFNWQMSCLGQLGSPKICHFYGVEKICSCCQTCDAVGTFCFLEPPIAIAEKYTITRRDEGKILASNYVLHARIKTLVVILSRLTTNNGAVWTSTMCKAIFLSINQSTTCQQHKCLNNFIQFCHVLSICLTFLLVSLL